MRFAIRLLLSLCVALPLRPHRLAAQTGADALAGDWIFFMTGDDQPQRVRLTADGDSLRGAVYGQRFAATMRRVGRDARLSFAVGSYRWRASVRNDSLVGYLGVAPDSSSWIGVRERRPAVPRAFRFEPRAWYRAVSASVAPALHVASGDTVHTTTVDAGGWGRGTLAARGSRVPGGNPLIGPIFVEQALPGDVLAVTLHRVRPNRDWAFSGTALVDNVIDAAYAAERRGSSSNAPQDNGWLLDTLTNSARLAKPPAALADYRVPLTPFLGVIATAPGGEQAPSSRESGSHGGNMESRWMTEGTTVLLPVRTTGAYLYLGDGHAAQGDGELTGDAMETSLDVTFSVEIRRWGFQDQVRAEDADQLMTMGVGGSLDEAMRRATSDMARWLERRYGFSATEAALLLGFSARFEIPDLVPPGYGVTLRVPKSVLGGATKKDGAT